MNGTFRSIFLLKSISNGLLLPVMSLMIVARGASLSLLPLEMCIRDSTHIGDGCHSCDILCRMMAHSQSAIANAAADSNQFYIGIGVSHIHLCLLITSCGKEAGGRNRICFFSTFGKSCCCLLYTSYAHASLPPSLQPVGTENNSTMPTARTGAPISIQGR